MATLTNTKIKDTYVGLLKTTDNQAIDASGVTLVEDGAGNASALSVGRSGNGVSVSGNLAVDTNTLYVDAANNRVGVGESSPARHFHVNSGTDNTVALFESTDSNAQIEIKDDTASSELSHNGSSFSIKVDPDNVGAGSNFLVIIDNDEKMRIDSSGNVGIGTSSPVQTLDVNGNINSNAYYINDSGGNDRNILQLDGSDNLLIATGTSTGARSVLFYTENTERMRIDSSGNVGIGTSSPDTMLHISDTLGNAVIRLERNDTAIVDGDTYGAIEFEGQDANAGASGVRGSIKGEAEASNGQLSLVFSTAASNSANTERMRIDSSGRVGIGTSSPATKIHTSDADTTAYSAGSIGGQDTSGTIKIQNLSTNADTFAAIDFNTNNNRVVNRIVSSHGSSTSNGFLAFITEGSGIPAERMRIDSNGTVSISKVINSATLPNTPSNHSLTLYPPVSTGYYGGGISWSEGTNTAASINAVDDGAGGALGLVLSTGNNTTISERMRITSGGDVLIGTTSLPNGSTSYGVGLTPASDDRMSIRAATSTTSNSGLVFFYNPNGVVGSIQTSGSSTSYNTSSDYRLKENVVEMTGALDRVDALKPSRFNFIADPETTVDGFLAHEVAEVVPEAISGEKDAVDEEGNPIYQGIDQSKLVPLLVGAIKELSSKVAVLESQLNA